MVERYDRELRIRFKGDPSLAREYIGEARKYVGLLKEQMAFQDLPTGVQQRTNADNVVFRSLVVGNEHIVEIDVTRATGWVEVDDVWVYVSSEDGLRVFDMAVGTQILHFTGLGDYEVDGVTPNGAFVFMSNSQAVRVDVDAVSAYGRTYPITELVQDGYSDPDPQTKCAVWVYVDGRAMPNEGKLSPDGTRVLWSFSTTKEPSPSTTTISGIGGFILADAESDTIEPLRDPIRMYHRPYGVSVWAPDSQRFYIASSLANDASLVEMVEESLCYTAPEGEEPQIINIAEYNTITASPNAYVAAFDRDGTLVGATDVYTYVDTAETGADGAGFRRQVQALAVSPDGAYVFAVVGRENAHPSGTGIDLRVVDTSSMSVLHEVQITEYNGFAHSAVADSSHVYVYLGDSSVVRVNWNPDFGFGEVDAYEVDNFVTSTDTIGASGEGYAYTNFLRLGPRGARNKMLRMTSPAETLFFYAKNSDTDGTLFGYGNLSNADKYRFDISSYIPNDRYALRHVRTYRRRA